MPLKELSAPEVAEGFLVGLGREQQPVGAENWMNSMANYITEKSLTRRRVTVGPGPSVWPVPRPDEIPRLHGDGVLALERTHHGYQKRGTGGEWYIA